MNRKAKLCLRSLLIFLVMGFILLNVLAYFHARAMWNFTPNGTVRSKLEEFSFLEKLRILFVGVDIPRPDSDGDPSILAPGCRALSIKGPDKITLAAWYCDLGEKTPLVALFHGYISEKASLLFEAKTLFNLGVSVLLVDFRGSGGSSESYTTIGVLEADDVGAVFRYANDNLSHTAIIMFGQSMGAAAILRAVDKQGIKPDAVILEAVFDNLINAVRNRFSIMGVPSFPSAQLLVFWGGIQWGFNGFEHNPVNYALTLSCPALFMHGSDDKRSTLAEARRVFASVPGPKDFRIFETVGHESYASRYPNEWKNAVMDIINNLGNHLRG